MEFKEDLKAYLDGELPKSQAQKIQDAAAQDPAIEKELDDLKFVSAALTGIKREYEVQGLEQTLNALSGNRAVHVTVPPKRRPWLGYSLGLGLAAVLAGLFTIPPMFSQAKMSAKSSLVSRRMSLQAPLAASPAMKSVPSPGFSARAQVPVNRSQGAANGAPKFMSVQDQLKSAQKQLEDLKRENQALRAETKGGLAPRNDKDYYALPAIPRQILPSDSGKFPGDETFSVTKNQGVAPKRVAELETQIRKLIAQAGGHVDSASGPSEIRTVNASIDSLKAPKLVSQIRLALKSSGDISVETPTPPSEQGASKELALRIADLKAQREKLLVQFLPEAPQVREIDDQLKALDETVAKPKAPQKSRIHVTIG